MGMSGWDRGDLNGYAWSQAFAEAEEALEYGAHSANREEDNWDDYEGEHRLVQVSQLGQVKELVYYAAHLRGFVQAEKPFEKICADPVLDALKKRLRGLSGQLEMDNG